MLIHKIYNYHEKYVVTYVRPFKYINCGNALEGGWDECSNINKLIVDVKPFNMHRPFCLIWINVYCFSFNLFFYHTKTLKAISGLQSDTPQNWYSNEQKKIIKL